MPKGVYKKPGDISIAKRVTEEQRVLQSSFSNQVEVQISKRPRLMKDQTQQHAVPYEEPHVQPTTKEVLQSTTTGRLQDKEKKTKTRKKWKSRKRTKTRTKTKT